MDQFRTARETLAAVTILFPVVTQEGPLQRPSGFPPAWAPGSASHMLILGLGPVYQEWTDGKMGLCGLVMAALPSSGCDCAHYCPFTFHQQAS